MTTHPRDPQALRRLTGLVLALLVLWPLLRLAQFSRTFGAIGHAWECQLCARPINFGSFELLQKQRRKRQFD